MAVALIQFWLAMPLALYGTLAILLLAYVGRYIPLGVRAANASLRQIDPSLEESAQILGASWAHDHARDHAAADPARPVRRLAAGVRAGDPGAVAPRSCCSRSSSITLAVAVYNLYETGYIEPVAALAMVNMVIIGAAIWLANRLGGGGIARPRRRAAGRSVGLMAGITHHAACPRASRAATTRLAAVADLDLDIKDNQFVTLLGPSGCGKTTTLRLIAGYIAPDAGTIHVDGRLLSSPGSVVPPEERGMGMVFQNYAVWPHKTVFENVVFGLKLRKVPAAEAREQGRGDAGAGQSHRPRGPLSERAVAAASSSASRSRAASWSSRRSCCSTSRCRNLDAKLRERMRGELKQLQRRTGITFVYVTHDQAEALALSDQIAVMHGGRLQQFGTPHEVYARPANRMVADFMGLVNLRARQGARRQQRQAARSRSAAGSRLDVAAADGHRPGDSVEVAIRPENIRLRGTAGAGQRQPRATITRAHLPRQHQRVLCDARRRARCCACRPIRRSSSRSASGRGRDRRRASAACSAARHADDSVA